MVIDPIIKDLKDRKFVPMYWLQGEETFFIDVISDYIQDHVLTDMEKEFNLHVLYGKETDVQTIISYCKRYPMMSEYQVVIVKEAQNLDKLDLLASYAEHPVKSTLLVFCYRNKMLDKRTSLFKKLKDHAMVFESKRLYDNQVAEWIASYVSRKKYKIGVPACQLLADFLGTDLSKIVNEVGKLFINLPQGSEITTRIIEENIGISKDFNVFELQNAFGRKDEFKVYQIAKYFNDNPKENPNIKTLAVLYNYFSKLLLLHHAMFGKPQSRISDRDELVKLTGLSPFFLEDYKKAARNYTYDGLIKIMSYLRDCDLKSKGVDNNSASDGELLMELSYKILHAS